MKKLLEELEQKYIEYILTQTTVNDILKSEFINLLKNNNSLEREDLWRNLQLNAPINNIEKLANPFYLGFGNPHSNILFVGKEKGFNTDQHSELFIKESINNTLHWKFIFDNNENLNNINQFDIQNQLGFNPIFPKIYHNKKFHPRHTWGLYSKIANGVELNNSTKLNESQIFNNSFFSKCFLTELNHIPSAYTNGLNMIEERRLFFMNDFYRSFTKVVIGAKGYLTIPQIRQLFEINNDGEEIIIGANKQREFRIIKFVDNGKTYIYCDQLSGAAGWTNDALGVLIRKLND
jgi:hypothetical protein